MTTEQKLVKLIEGGQLVLHSDCGHLSIEKQWTTLDMSLTPTIHHLRSRFEGNGYIPLDQQLGEVVSDLYEKREALKQTA